MEKPTSSEACYNEPTEPKIHTPAFYANKDKMIFALSRGGFALMALREKQGEIGPYGKVPSHAGWREFKPDPLKSAADFHYNYGVIPSHEHLIIDADPRNYKPDTGNSFKRLMSQFPQDLGNAFVVESGRRDGGMHYYFRKNPSVKIRKNMADYPGLDFISDGSFVVGPLSKHPATLKLYRPVNGVPYELPEVTPELLAFLEKTEIDTTNIKEATEFNSDEITKRRFVSWLTHGAPVAVQDGGGEPTTFTVAAKGVRDYNLHPDDVLELLLEHWNPRCEPPWEPDELKIKVINALNYGSNPRGLANATSEFSPVSKKDDLRSREMAMCKWDKTPVKIIRMRNKDGHMVPVETGGQPVSNSALNIGTYFFLDKVKNAEGMEVPNPLYRSLRWNLLCDSIEIVKQLPWGHKDLNNNVWHEKTDPAAAADWFHRTLHYKASPTVINNAVVAVAKFYQCNPVVDYLENLEWDGVPRLDTLLIKYAGAADNDYTRAVTAVNLIGAVKRALQPGCKHDTVLILEGPQGLGKSLFFKTLGGEFCGDTKHINIESPQNCIPMLRSMWFWEIPEMVSYKKSDVDAMKAFITQQVDSYNPKYGTGAVNEPRRFIFFGTINPTEEGYLRDTTGNRRYHPVVVTRLDIKGLEQIRDQVWAEAVYRLRAGEPNYIVDDAVIQQIATEQQHRQITDALEQKVYIWATCRFKGHGRWKPCTTYDVCTDALNLVDREINRGYQVRVANIMINLGFMSERQYVGKRKQSYWVPKPESEFVGAYLGDLV